MPVPPQKIPILYEDNHLFVVVKPPGIATMGLPEGETTLLTLARDTIKQKYRKPGNVYLGVVSRLDVPVSGVVVFARTSKAAERINAQFRERCVEKEYVALVGGRIEPPRGECRDWLVHDERHRSVRVVDGACEGAQEALLEYEQIRRDGSVSFVKIALHTGRKHQIRVQLSSRGFPILGDRKYGSTVILPKPWSNAITLHAARLSIAHPVSDERMTFDAPIPTFWRRWGAATE
ncbi:MAG: RluA family pseudouridine synthase [Thermoguttaceae bacterium]